MEAEYSRTSDQIEMALASNRHKKKTLEWDLNDWRWDSNRFFATPLNVTPSECTTKELFMSQESGLPSNAALIQSEEIDFGVALREKENGEPQKKRRVFVVEEDDDEQLSDEPVPLALAAGDHHAIAVVETDRSSQEERNGRNGSSSTRPSCKVDGCNADLSDARDYHRRHKVCEAHSKMSVVLVKNVEQRFCQQCSRFHLLQEFDEGKKSCRRRLASHNGRRRKNQPQASSNGSSLPDDRAMSQILLTLLRLLANSESSNTSDQPSGLNPLVNLLKNLSTLAGSSGSRENGGLIQAAPDLHRNGHSTGTSTESGNAVANGDCGGASPESANASANGSTPQELYRLLSNAPKDACIVGTQSSSDRLISSKVAGVPPAKVPLVGHTTGPPIGQRQTLVHSRNDAIFMPVDVPSSTRSGLRSVQHVLPEEPPMKNRLNNFDLNNAFSDQGTCSEDHVHMPTTLTEEACSLNCPPCMLDLLNPRQRSSNPGSLSARPFGCGGDEQYRTEKIVFKLFGKEPNDLPHDLGSQIHNWLANCPSDMESYIRPGCILLTVYLRLPHLVWEKLDGDLSTFMEKLINMSASGFWSTGWVYARVQQHMALIYNGRILIEAPWRSRIDYDNHMLCVTPIAVACSSVVNFSVKGFNLADSTARLLCAFDGKYLVQETTKDLVSDNTCNEQGLQCLSFSCSFPNLTGRGFIEVEDYDHSSLVFPFIVAEEHACSEICMLEREINIISSDDISEERKVARIQALYFLQEIGWLLQRSRTAALSERLECCPEGFSVERFKWLMSFAIDRQWCAVVKKLLDILFQDNIDLGARSSLEFACGEDWLHKAVGIRSISLVKLLLSYRVDKASNDTSPICFPFAPDMIGPSKMTPLHIAATITGAEEVLDALTDDSQQLGIRAWKNARDKTGYTPEHYAREKGHESYIQMVQHKIDRSLCNPHVSITIPSSILGTDLSHKKADELAGKGTQHMKNSPWRKEPQPYCKKCVQRLACRPHVNKLMSTRPVMLSMVMVAAVCVCVGLLFCTPPTVQDAQRPFLWDSLGSGSM